MSGLHSLISSFLCYYCTLSTIVFQYNSAYDISKVRNLVTDDSWNNFVTKYNKSYSGLELAVRKAIFQENLKFINEHNLLFNNGTVFYKLGINHFADLTHDEMGIKGNKYDIQNTIQDNDMLNNELMYGDDSELPISVNWVKKKYVTSVKSQGNNCGSCYAFAAIASLEGQYKRRYNELKSFSVQNILDCGVKNGCFGGIEFLVFNFIEVNGGLATEKQYPYKGRVGKCKMSSISKVRFNLIGYNHIKSGDEEHLMSAVANIGPISVRIDASSFRFIYYLGGIYHFKKCGKPHILHSVTVVGYGVQKGEKYWLIKNQWSTLWGESGYMKLARGKNNCGFPLYGFYPILA